VSVLDTMATWLDFSISGVGIFEKKRIKNMSSNESRGSIAVSKERTS
jgi:hypothetical protein